MDTIEIIKKIMSGKHIIVSKNPIQYEALEDIVVTRLNGTEIAIHERHKDILEAYLLDNDIGIEYYREESDKWVEQVRCFIGFYREDLEYRLKDTIKQLRESFTDEELECAENLEHYIKKENKIRRKIKGLFLSMTLTEALERGYTAGNSSEKKEVNGNIELVPYDCVWLDNVIYRLKQEPKKWYEIESNFPCLMYSKKQNNSYMNCDDSETYLRWIKGDGEFRLATNEEIESLKIKD